MDVTSGDLHPVAPLTPEQQAWAQHSEPLWRQAHAVVDAYPERRLFAALRERGVRFLIIGLGAAVIEGAIEREIEGVVLRILPLERVIASKRATSRPKDAASLPALEATLQARGKTT